MRKLLIGLLASLVVAALAPVGRTDVSKLVLVHAHPRNDAEAAYLMSSFDETHNHGPTHLELLLWPGDRPQLDAAGIDYEVVVEDVVARDRALSRPASGLLPLPGPDRSDYRRLGDYEVEMKDLAQKNPKLVKLIEMPHASLEGRTIYGLEIAAPARGSDGRPVYYVDALHHAREWPAAEFVMIYAHHLVEGYGKDKSVTALLENARVILVPLVNPDGFDYSRESVLSQNQTVADQTWPTALGNGFEGYWRKNRRSLTGVTVPAAQKNPDAYGVDPNRNYAYLWGDTRGGSSSTQVSQTYRGEAPFSEPETQNVRDLVLSEPVTAVITNHTYQATVLRAGGGAAPDDALLSRIAEKIANAMGYASRPSVGYPTTGTTDDWSYAALGALGYTIEHGSINFHPPYDVGVAEPAEGVMKGFMIAGRAAADARYHAVLAGRVSTGKAALTLTKKLKTPLSEGNPLGKKFVTEKVKFTLTTRRDGSFTWHVPQSIRPYERKRESYTLTVTAGEKKTSTKVLLERGDRLNLGTIRL